MVLVKAHIQERVQIWDSRETKSLSWAVSIDSRMDPGSHGSFNVFDLPNLDISPLNLSPVAVVDAPMETLSFLKSFLTPGLDGA